MEAHEFHEYLLNLIKALEFEKSDLPALILKIENNLRKHETERDQLYEKRESLRQDYYQIKRDYDHANLYNLTNKKHLWADLDSAENRFSEITSIYRNLVLEMQQTQSDLRSIRSDHIRTIELLRKLNSKVHLASLVKARYINGELIEFMILPQFVRNKFYSKDLEIFAEESPIGSSVIGNSKGALCTYIAPNGRTFNFKIEEFSNPTLEICLDIFARIYSNENVGPNTFRIKSYENRAHRNRTEDGARENWSLQCAVCGGYNNIHHRCKCYFL